MSASIIQNGVNAKKQLPAAADTQWSYCVGLSYLSSSFSRVFLKGWRLLVMFNCSA